MSFGSISREAHTTLAIAMNRIGGKSNTAKAVKNPIAQAAAERRQHASVIKQVAWPVRRDDGISRQLRHDADQEAQGAKPGEGGQLPGHKVDATIARVRY
jgi:glutamate synthase (NADPH/NADH) large chain